MNKKLFYFILIISTLVLLTSCAPQITPPPTPPPTPQYCTVIVTSQRADVWGQAVYMDGNPMPNTILAPWGSAQINNVTVPQSYN